MDLFVEFKIADPFREPEDPLQPKAGNFRFEYDSDDARLVRGQLASYAAAHVGRYFLCTCMRKVCEVHSFES